MKKIYVTPFAKEILTEDDAIPAFAQSGGDVTLVFGSCDGGPTTIVGGDRQVEGCFGGDPAGSSVVILCSETGSAQHEIFFGSSSAGSQTCSEGSAFLVQVSLSDNFPSICTVTSSVDSRHCDACNIEPESTGDGNCGDGIDNDCDGAFDSGDINCAG